MLAAACLLAGPAAAVELGPGSFWEFRRLEESTSFAQGSGGSSTFDLGRFRITLGQPLTIAGVPMFEVELSGLPGGLSLGWDRLGVDAAGRFFGSGRFGGPLQTLYDPTGAAWTGGGLFTEFPNGTLMLSQPSTFSGSFFSGPADKVEQSFDQNNCQLILGILICGGDMDINLSRREFWSPSLGPVGLLYSFSFSSCGGSFCSGSTEDTDVGLVRSSLAGDVPGYSLETEPSQLSTPMPLPRQLPAFLGFAHPADAFDALNVGGTNRVHDAYAFTLNAREVVGFMITWPAGHQADLDFFIVDNPPNVLLATSNEDNVALGVYEEFLEADLPAGDYLLLVQHYSIPTEAQLAPPPVEYIVAHTLPEPGAAAGSLACLAALAACRRLVQRRRKMSGERARC